MTLKKTFNPYVWLVWGLPAAVVVAGIVTVFIAFNNADPLVSDDYYRDGLAINQDKEADARAAVLQLSADIKKQDDKLIVELRGQLIYPEQLLLVFEHPTQAQHDKTWTLQHSGNGIYQATSALTFKEIESGSWYINLSPLDKLWRLRSTGNLTEQLRLTFIP